MIRETTFSKRKFFLDGLLLTLVGIAMRSVSMLFGAFTSRAVGAEGIGLYTLVMTVYSFAVTLATSGVSLTVTRLTASAIGEGRADDVGRILRGAVIYASSFGLLATLILFFGSDIISTHILYDPRAALSLRLLALSLIPASLSAVFSGYFVGIRCVAFNAVTQVSAQIIKITLTVLLVTALAPRGLSYAIAALAIGISTTEILAFLIFLVEYLLDLRKRRARRTSGSSLSAIVRNAGPLALSQYVRSVLLSLEHVLIPRRLLTRGESREEAFGHYGSLHGMALPVILYPMSPLSSFAGLLVPEFAGDAAADNRSRMNRIAERTVNTTLSYSIVMMLFISAFSEELGYLLYRSYDAGHYVAMLAPVIPIMYLDHVTDSMLKGIGEQVYSMWVNITDSLISIILVWILIPRMGIAGYALVIVIMEGYNFLLSFLRLSRHVRYRILPLETLLLPFLSATAALSLTNRLLRVGGSGASVVWVVLKILFAISAFAMISALSRLVLVNTIRKKRQKHT